MTLVRAGTQSSPPCSSLQLLAPRPASSVTHTPSPVTETKSLQHTLQPLQLLTPRRMGLTACAPFPSYWHADVSCTLVSLVAGTCELHPLLQLLTQTYEPYGLWSLQLTGNSLTCQSFQLWTSRAICPLTHGVFDACRHLRLAAVTRRIERLHRKKIT